ncbi:MAG: ABC transporter substrate-binding protein [Clostridia bacterium]
MKRISKILSLTVMTSLLLASFTGCSTQESTSDDVVKIGVIQFGSHPSLDNCYTGILEGLEEAGFEYEIDFQNGNFDQATCDTIAKTMVSGGVDIILPIATSPAISAYSAGMETETPVVFVAISDPVAAGLVDSVEVPGGHATGSSSVINLEKQLELIMAVQPDLEKLGVLYTTSEANSVSDIARIKEVAVTHGIEIVDVGIQSAADIPQAAADLASKVDAINNLADNNVVNNLATVIEIANAAGIPVYGSEEEQVENGCIASEGIDYVQVGVAAAGIAIDVVNGADISNYAVTVIDDATPFINTEVMESFGFEIPDAYADATMLASVTE